MKVFRKRVQYPSHPAGRASHKLELKREFSSVNIIIMIVAIISNRKYPRICLNIYGPLIYCAEESSFKRDFSPRESIMRTYLFQFVSYSAGSSRGWPFPYASQAQCGLLWKCLLHAFGCFLSSFAERWRWVDHVVAPVRQCSSVFLYPYASQAQCGFLGIIMPSPCLRVFPL